MGNITIINNTDKAVKLRFENEVEPRKRYAADNELEHQTFLQGKSAIAQQTLWAKQNPHGLLLSPNEVAIFDDDTDAYDEMLAHRSVLESRHGLTVEVNA